jgi:hypothetical protein
VGRESARQRALEPCGRGEGAQQVVVRLARERAARTTFGRASLCRGPATPPLASRARTAIVLIAILRSRFQNGRVEAGLHVQYLRRDKQTFVLALAAVDLFPL